MRGYSKKIHLFVFALGVLMLLLRPYLVYQMTAGDNVKNPERAWSMLQRLIKKKDEHHEQMCYPVSAVLQGAFRLRPPRRPFYALSDLQNLFTVKKKNAALPKTIFLPVQLHRYRLTSCMLI